MSRETADTRRDPVIEAFKKDIDRTVLRDNLRLTPEQRLRKLHAAVQSIVALRAGRRRPQV